LAPASGRGLLRCYMENLVFFLSAVSRTGALPVRPPVDTM